MSTFILLLDGAGPGPRLAVKDLVDVAGTPTTAGSQVVAERAAPASADAPCLAGARAAGAAIVGKTNLNELAFGTNGVNPWFGTPVNPIDPALVPGGSSSGSAVAVATGEAEVAYGSDTGGSIRVPAACCGTTGLKTTHGRIPTAGVWPLAPSLDTVGPMAASVAGLVSGMAWLEPGFVVSPGPAHTVGRLRLRANPVIDAAVDALLHEAGLDVTDLELPDWGRAWDETTCVLEAEAAEANRALLGSLDRVDPDVAVRLERGRSIDAGRVAAARRFQARWREEMAGALRRVQLIALPTLLDFPPRLEEAAGISLTAATNPVNLAGVPALALPVPAGDARPASLQLVGPQGGEALLLATGVVLEGAAASLR